MKSREEDAQWAYQFTKTAFMKFQPKQDYQDPNLKQPSTLSERVKAYFSPQAKPKPKSSKGLRRMNTLVGEIKIKRTKRKGGLKYVHRLTNQHVLVGNEDQLDAMCISRIIDGFIDIQFMWSLNVGKPVVHISLDYKKNCIVIVSETKLIIYQFDPKSMKTQPISIGSIGISRIPKFLQVVKEATYLLAYENQMQVYTLDPVTGLRIIMNKKYNMPHQSFHLYTVPEPIDNLLNIFFQEVIEGVTALWVLKVEIFQDDLKVCPQPTKVYEIPQIHKEMLSLKNYSKQVFLINLGQEMVAIRKGYVLDKIKVNIENGKSYLKYISQNKLVHISQTKADVYEFKVDTSANPPKITVKSNDSIAISGIPENYDFLHAVEIMGTNFAVFYQTKQNSSKVLHGEIRYSLMVTQAVRRQQKITKILPQKIENISFDTVQQKADMVGKMGMSRKEIYLRLWQNSSKSQIQDFKYLLDTKDYATVKHEIEKKLKKHSMSFREIYLIEQGCFSMLQQQVFSVRNDKNLIQNYLISHMFLKKMELYREIKVDDNIDNHEKLTFDIQNYNYYKEADVRSLLLELISQYVNQDKKTLLQIRKLIKNFKFCLINVYTKLLDDIINLTKKKFIKLIQALPELLPFKPNTEGKSVDEIDLLSGIWADITRQQWQKELYLDTVSTIDNRVNLKQICESVWFKRYWLTQHMFCNLNKAAIHKKHCELRDNVIFYHVIAKVFANIDQVSGVKKIIDHIQDKYENLPRHLYGKIFLYNQLYRQFKKEGKSDSICDTFERFLAYQDQDIFKSMFAFEKIRKGFIIKQMKPLYTKLSSNQIFNQGLLNFFASQKSHVSDIKYLLNRINNQKKQFHDDNNSLYQVLVRGMQLKLTLGSQKDIPIDEVLIYMQNIQFPEDSQIVKQLEIMKLINSQNQRFKKAKLNMTIFDMTKNVDSVIAALVHYQVKQRKVKQIEDIEELKKATVNIVKDIQTLRSKIFGDQYSQLCLFVYLTDLMQQQKMVSNVGFLLQQPWIVEQFNFDQTMVQNLVLYMYKWQLSRNPSYLQSQNYLNELLTLLPSQNKCRQYIQSQIQLACLFSTPKQPIKYPLTGNSEYFTAEYLQIIISTIDGQHLNKISIQRVYQCATRMQQISTDGSIKQITMRGVYLRFIIRLIDCGMLKQSLEKTRLMIEMQGANAFDFVYPALVIAKIAPQMIDQNRKIMYRCCSRLFFQPERLLSLLEDLLKQKYSSAQYKAIFMDYYDKAKQSKYLNYSLDNPLLEPLYLQHIKTQQQQESFVRILKAAFWSLYSHRQEFRLPEFQLIFTILCNNPSVLPKYLYHNRYIINIKDFRCFLSYLLKEDCFQKDKLLEFAKRTFYCIYKKTHDNIGLNRSIEEMNRIPLTESQDIPKLEAVGIFEGKIVKSIERIKNKIKTIQQQRRRASRAGLTPEAEKQKKIKQIQQKMKDPKPRQDIKYPFGDSDDDPKSKQTVMRRQEKMPQVPAEFDPVFQRLSLMDRNADNLGLYVSSQRQKKQRNLFYTQKFSKDTIHGQMGIDLMIGGMMKHATDNFFKNVNAGGKLKVGKAKSQYIQLQELSKLHQASVEQEHTIQQIPKEEDLNNSKDLINSKDLKIVDLSQKIGLYAQVVNVDNLITETTQLNFAVLQEFKDHHQFDDFLKNILNSVFENQKVSFKGALIFAKKMQNHFQSLGVKLHWVQIYERADSLQQKFSLNLPLKEIFPLKGLFKDTQIRQSFFQYLLPTILSHLNDQNILKLCKVITLAFKKPDLEHQILFNYLLELTKNYYQAINKGAKRKQMKNDEEKLFMMLNKVPVKLLAERYEDLMLVVQGDCAKTLAQLLVRSFRYRYDHRSADAIESRWLLNNKRK